MNILRVDNVFFNSKDNVALAEFYSALTGIAVRRAQEEAPGMMWVEIGIGGMELAFRKAEKTAEIHPHLGKIYEVPPGRGATISFETNSTDRSRQRLEEIGATLHGDPIICTGGQEIISVFSDPAGRPVQLYEPRFASDDSVVMAARPADKISGSRDHLSDHQVLTGSNLRSLGDLAYSVAFYDPAPLQIAEFYSDLMQTKAKTSAADETVWFNLDGTVIEIRSKGMGAELFGEEDGDDVIGVVLMLEAHNLDSSLKRMSGMNRKRVRLARSDLGQGRASLRDPDDNPLEFWERPRN